MASDELDERLGALAQRGHRASPCLDHLLDHVIAQLAWGCEGMGGCGRGVVAGVAVTVVVEVVVELVSD